MKKRLKGIQIFLVIAISVFILAPTAYLRYTNLLNAKFLSSDLVFENPDQENRAPDNENNLEVFGPTAFFIISLLSINLFEQSLHFFPQPFSLRHKTFGLRC